MGRFVIVLLCAAPLVAAPVPKAVKKKPTIDGVWELVEHHSGGVPTQLLCAEYWVIDGDTLGIYTSQTKDVSIIRDPSTTVTPASFTFPDPQDATAFDMKGHALPSVGRFEVQNDTLKIVFGVDRKQTRPAATKPALGVNYSLFKRVDDPRPKAK